MLGVAAFFDDVLRRLMLHPDPHQLLIAVVVLAVVGTQAALTFVSWVTMTFSLWCSQPNVRNNPRAGKAKITPATEYQRVARPGRDTDAGGSGRYGNTAMPARTSLRLRRASSVTLRGQVL